MRRLLKIGFVCALLAGCGNQGDVITDPGQTHAVAPTPNAAARAKCETFLSTVCGRIADCTNDPPDRAARLDLCLQGARTKIDCGKAASVGESFDRCIQEVQAQDCALAIGTPDVMQALPASCTGVIGVVP